MQSRDDTYLIAPDPAAPRLTRAVTGTDQTGATQTIPVVEERPLTIYLNSQEIVTAMTIGDHPEYLALGFLLNQGMLKESDQAETEEHHAQGHAEPLGEGDQPAIPGDGHAFGQAVPESVDYPG